MQLIWVLPSLLFGAYMGISSGSWLLLAMAAMSASAALLSINIRRLQQIDFDLPIEFFEGRFWVGAKRLPKYRFFWRREWNHHFYRYFESLAQADSGCIAFVDRPEFADPGPLCALVGYSDNQPLVASFIADGPHLLIIGPTGAGKSVLLRQVLGSLASGSLPSEANFAFFDFKGGATFGSLHGSRVQFSTTDLQPDKANEALAEIAFEMSRRERILSDARIDNFQQAPTVGQPLPALFVMVDELGALLRASKVAPSTFEALVSKGRSLGIFLIAASQSLSGVPRTMQLNMRQRIALKGADPVDLNQLGFVSRSIVQTPGDTSVLSGSWINAAGEIKLFLFRPDFNLEKTFINRHF